MGTQRRPATEAEAKALASAIRLRILRLCLEEPLTNRELAARLGANPATVLHHVRKLVDTGFLAPQEARRGTRGAREIPYLATGKSWTLSVGHRTRTDRRAMIDAFLQEVELVEDPEEVLITRLGLRLSQDEYEQLLSRFQELVDEFAARPRTHGGRPYSIFIALHPDVGRASGPDAAQDDPAA